MRRIEIWDPDAAAEFSLEPVASVAELIEKLSKIRDKNRRVVLAGCDCRGFWSGQLSYDSEGDVTLLGRSGPGRDGFAPEPTAPYVGAE